MLNRELSLQFKTSYPDGVIAFTGTDSTYLVLELVEGSLIFTAQRSEFQISQLVALSYMIIDVVFKIDYFPFRIKNKTHFPECFPQILNYTVFTRDELPPFSRRREDDSESGVRPGGQQLAQSDRAVRYHQHHRPHLRGRGSRDGGGFRQVPRSGRLQHQIGTSCFRDRFSFISLLTASD